jgi:hypothetical protein
MQLAIIDGMMICLPVDAKTAAYTILANVLFTIRRMTKYHALRLHIGAATERTL